MRRRERLFKKFVKRDAQRLRRANRRGLPSSEWRDARLGRQPDGSYELRVGPTRRAASGLSPSYRIVSSRGTYFPPWWRA